MLLILIESESNRKIEREDKVFYLQQLLLKLLSFDIKCACNLSKDLFCWVLLLQVAGGKVRAL